MTFEIPVSERTLGLIRSGRKRIEVRVADSDYSALHPGSFARFVYEEEQVLRIVRGVRHYTTVEDLVAAEDWARIEPEAASAEDAAQRILKHPTYAARAKSGFVAIELEPSRP